MMSNQGGSFKDVVSLSDQKASKQAFLDLTDKKLNILHIAISWLFRLVRLVSEN